MDRLVCVGSIWWRRFVGHAEDVLQQPEKQSKNKSKNQFVRIDYLTFVRIPDQHTSTTYLWKHRGWRPCLRLCWQLVRTSVCLRGDQGSSILIAPSACLRTQTNSGISWEMLSRASNCEDWIPDLNRRGRNLLSKLESNLVWEVISWRWSSYNPVRVVLPSPACVASEVRIFIWIALHKPRGKKLQDQPHVRNAARKVYQWAALVANWVHFTAYFVLTCNC